MGMRRIAVMGARPGLRVRADAAAQAQDSSRRCSAA